MVKMLLEQSAVTQFRPYQLIADGTASRTMIFDAEL